MYMVIKVFKVYKCIMHILLGVTTNEGIAPYSLFGDTQATGKTGFALAARVPILNSVSINTIYKVSVAPRSNNTSVVCSSLIRYFIITKNSCTTTGIQLN